MCRLARDLFPNALQVVSFEMTDVLVVSFEMADNRNADRFLSFQQAIFSIMIYWNLCPSVFSIMVGIYVLR